MGSLIQDIRLAVRMLWKRPIFTLVAVLALALGVGANTAVFSLINGVLLRPLDFEKPQQLYMLWRSVPDEGIEADLVAPGNFLDWRDQSSAFRDMAAFNLRGLRMRVGEESQFVSGALVTPSFFQMLGVQPSKGAGFTLREPTDAPVYEAVLSHRVWQRNFGSDPNIVGTELLIDDRSHTVTGVLPQGFSFFADVDVWVPMFFTPEDRARRGDVFLWALGRLKDGITEEQAREDLNGIARRLGDQYPGTNLGVRVQIDSLHTFWVGDVQQTLPLLMGVVFLVLLVACANIATMMLSRALERRREMALRRSLGAGRGRLIRQTFVESIVLSLLGGVVGAGLGALLVDLLVKLEPSNIPRLDEVSVDPMVLLFTAGIAALAGVLFGVLPAIQGSRVRLTDALKEGGSQASSAGAAKYFRSGLVVLEVALAMILLMGAGLTIRSFQKLQQVDSGFDPEGVVVASSILSEDRYQVDAQVLGYIDSLLERLEAMPSVQSAGIVSTLPLDNAQIDTDLYIEGSQARNLPPLVGLDAVAGDYFRAMGTQVIAGRTFTDQDREGSLPVMIVNQALAETFWPGENAVGKLGQLTEFPGVQWQVVGVVENIKRFGLEADSRREVYLPYQQFPSERSFYVVGRSGSDGTASLSRDLRAAAQEIDRAQPLQGVTVMEELVSESLAPRRFNTWLIGISSVVALILALVGIYGILAYTVTQSQREIGVRMALGEQRVSVLRLFLRRGILLTALGLLIGIVGTLFLAELISRLLFEVGVADPVTLVVVSVIFLLVAALASYVPARRATKVDPMVALRYE
ncbi:MAG: ABC transporter permease [Acidobacteriota bacterium]|nr:ABC transporter permease [Acidobacteriota bacterium]